MYMTNTIIASENTSLRRIYSSTVNRHCFREDMISF
ncbi:hypothetical protein LMIY3S_01731 [Labrys miyagiensis]